VLLMLSATLGVSPSALAYVSPEALPKGVRALAYVYGFASGIDSRLDESGLLEDLARPLNRSVTIAELAEHKPELLRLQNVLADMDPTWASDLLSVNLYADVSAFESRKVTGLLWGITDRFSVGMQIPFIEREVSFGFSADVVNNAGAIKSGVGDIKELRDGLEILENTPINTQTFTQEIFLARGYNAPQSRRVSAWGDVEVETRYTYFIGDRWSLGLRSGFRAPTSSYRPDIRNVLDQDLAENTWAFKAMHLSEFQIIPRRLSWSASLGGVMRLEKTQTRAYALSESDSLPDLRDPRQIEKVRKTIGPEMNAGSGLQLSALQGWVNFMGSYFYSAKAEDQIRGTRGLDYARETRGSASQTHGYELGVEVSSFSSFRRNSFPLPFKVAAAYVHPVGGRNAIYAPYWRFDSALLF